MARSFEELTVKSLQIEEKIKIGSLSFPETKTVLVGRDTLDTLENKIISGKSNVVEACILGADNWSIPLDRKSPSEDDILTIKDGKARWSRLPCKIVNETLVDTDEPTILQSIVWEEETKGLFFDCILLKITEEGPTALSFKAFFIINDGECKRVGEIDTLTFGEIFTDWQLVTHNESIDLVVNQAGKYKYSISVVLI